jgi:hypothetical protein
MVLQTFSVSLMIDKVLIFIFRSMHNKYNLPVSFVRYAPRVAMQGKSQATFNAAAGTSARPRI